VRSLQFVKDERKQTLYSIKVTPTRSALRASCKMNATAKVTIISEIKEKNDLYFQYKTRLFRVSAHETAKRGEYKG